MGKTKAKKDEKLVRITLPRIGGQNAVYVSVGERSWRIMRGKTVNIPECAYDVLCNAQIAENAAVEYIESVH